MIDVPIESKTLHFARSVALIPEESEDMWHAFNLISEGDRVRSTTLRKVQNESATGSSSSNKIRTTLTISVENIDFDTQACVLRLKGRNVEENQFVKVISNYVHCLNVALINTFFVCYRWARIIRLRLNFIGNLF